MKNARLLVIGLLGWTAFLILFPRLDPSARWGYGLGRQEALQKAQQVAARFGHGFAVGRSGVQAESQERELYFLSRFPASPAAEFAHPVITSVRLDPQQGRSLTIRMDPAGRVFGFERERPQTGSEVSMGSEGISVSTAKDDPSLQEPDKPVTPEEAEAIVRQALSGLAGANASAFEQETTSGKEGEILRYTFKAPSLGDENATPEAAFEFRQGGLAEAAVNLEFAEGFRREASDRGDGVGVLRAVSALLLFLGVLVGLGFYLVGSVDREIRHRAVLQTALALIPFQAVFFLWGGGWDASVLDSDAAWEAALEQALFFVFVLLPLVAVMRGVGNMLAVRSKAARVVTADLFLQGGWRLRPVGRSIGWGVMLGGAAAAAPYLAAAVIPGAEASGVGASVVSAPLPSLAALDFLASGPVVWILFVFAFLAPLTAACLKKRPRLSRALLLGTGLLVVAGFSGIEVSAWGALLSSVLILLAGFLLYRRAGLLAVAVMACSAQAATKAGTLVVQPTEALQWQGYLAFAALGLVQRVRSLEPPNRRKRPDAA